MPVLATAFKQCTGKASVSYFELLSDPGQEEFPTIFLGVHHAQSTDLITYSGTYIVHIFIIKQIWDFSCPKNNEENYSKGIII
jgi:hypothetical protein